MKNKSFIIEDGKYSLEAIVIACGKDLNVTICGGTKHHIGACAVGTPLKDVEVFCLPDHRESEIVKIFAKELPSYFNCVVAVTIGIHVDNATKKEIDILIKNCYLMLDKIKNYKVC